jgi:hypothetical protein
MVVRFTAANHSTDRRAGEIYSLREVPVRGQRSLPLAEQIDQYAGLQVIWVTGLHSKLFIWIKRWNLRSKNGSGVPS